MFLDIDSCACLAPADQCQNDGLCIDTDPVGGGTGCACPCGHDGGRCENTISECCNYGPYSPSPVCLNGGTCNDGTRNAPFCECPPCWTGQFCEIRKLTTFSTKGCTSQETMIARCSPRVTQILHEGSIIMRNRLICSATKRQLQFCSSLYLKVTAVNFKFQYKLIYWPFCLFCTVVRFHYSGRQLWLPGHPWPMPERCHMRWCCAVWLRHILCLYLWLWWYQMHQPHLWVLQLWTLYNGNVFRSKLRQPRMHLRPLLRGTILRSMWVSKTQEHHSI